MKLLLCLFWLCVVDAFLHKPFQPKAIQIMSSKEANMMTDEERRKLWKFVSTLEKEAIKAISNGNITDEDINKTIQLFALSTRSKNSDPFVQLINQYLNAMGREDKDEMDEILKLIKEVGFPPYIQDIVRQNRIGRFAPALKTSGSEMEVIDPGSMFSDTTTEKIRVKIQSFYDRAKSEPSQGKFMFWYKVGIFNEGNEPVQIVSRMWEIEKCRGTTEVVRGVGIIGTQPIIPPGEVFTYKSVCPLKVFPPKGKRIIGSMSGLYTLCKGNLGQQNFNVKVGKVNFILPEEISITLI